MFSKACEYGVRAVIFIAMRSLTTKRVGIKEIAEEIDSPIAFTAKILQKLVRCEIVKSTKGVGGGFMVEPERLKQIKLLEIIEAIDGESVLQGCALGLKDCSESHPCPIHNKFKLIKEEITNMLESTTLEQMTKDIELGRAFLRY